MRLKMRASDFRVRELLREGLVGPQGEHRVYRVTKRKLTSPEAAGLLAREAGVSAGDVSMAGYKDRQGITVQHMSIHRGRELVLDAPELKIEALGFAEQALSSSDSEGNGFEITVRGLSKRELDALRDNLEAVREHGVPNYFDDQRFGNLRHGQGWIARQLMLGQTEAGLRALLTAEGEYESESHARVKRAFDRAWGDWETCLSIARKVGQHRSIFEHLVDNSEDFAGAFRFVASRVRLIHLFAYQSHLWNRGVVKLLRDKLELEQRVVVGSLEGPLVCPAGALPKGFGGGRHLPAAGSRTRGRRGPRPARGAGGRAG